MKAFIIKFFGILGLGFMFIGGIIGIYIPFIVIKYIKGNLLLSFGNFILLIVGLMIGSAIIGGLGYLILRIIESRISSD